MGEDKEIQLPSNVNKDIIQSYRFTMARCKWTATEKRIIIRLTEMAQCQIKGLKIKDHRYQIVPNKLLQLQEIIMPLQALFPEDKDLGGSQYKLAKAAFKSLAKKGMEYETKDMWQYTQIISSPKLFKRGGESYAKFRVEDDIWYCLVDFSAGYRKYEMLTAMSFDSIYSMRLYEIVSGQKNKIPLSLDTIKTTFKLSKNMSTPQKIEEKILNIAKRDLDAKAPYSFDYERIEVKSKGRNGKKVVGYNLYPHFIHANRNNALEVKDIAAKLPAGGKFGGLLSPELYNYLTINLQWSKGSVNSNKQTLLKAQKTLPDLLSDLSYFNAKARDKANPVGYVIQSIKNKIEQYERDNERKRQEAHEGAQTPESKSMQQPKQQQPQATAAPVEDGKRKIQSVASILANNFSVKEQDMFNPSKSARPIPYKDKK